MGRVEFEIPKKRRGGSSVQEKKVKAKEREKERL